MQRRHHYEHAFEAYLRARRIPYVAVNEARKALLPEGRMGRGTGTDEDGGKALKSFDAVIYGQGSNLLVEVKGRRIGGRIGGRMGGRAGARGGRLESWVTLDDVESLERWEVLFGSGFEAAFVFVYWCEEMPPDALFEEIFEDSGRWYAIRSVRVGAYRRGMRTRSEKWRTVHLPARLFEQMAEPLAPGGEGHGEVEGARPMAGLDRLRGN